MTPIGLVSVMPQPCTTRAPNCRSKRSTIAAGAAEPPTPAIFRPSARGSMPGWASRYWNSISHTVGTAVEKVTRSSRSSL